MKTSGESLKKDDLRRIKKVMANYANQKTIIMPRDIKEKMGPKEGQPFLLTDWDFLERHCSQMNEIAMKLFLYFLRWSGTEKSMFSKQSFMNRYNITQRKSVARGIDELKRLGYIKEEGNKYYFCIPDISETKTIKKKSDENEEERF